MTRDFSSSAAKAPAAAGDDKTAIMFTTAHKPGALAEVLDVFKENGINLTDIEKRPSKKVNWEYYFFIDAQGHTDDPAMKTAIEQAGKHCLQLTVLGSYPRATEVLRNDAGIRIYGRFPDHLPRHHPHCSADDGF